MRAWLSLRLAGIEFEEIVIRLDEPDYRKKLKPHSPSGLVPVLKTPQLVIHDSLAIAEYANELSDGALLPMARDPRALCRSLVAELHSGFNHLRERCSYLMKPCVCPDLAAAMQRELDRLQCVWSAQQGDFYFDRPTMMDAFHAIMACRLRDYGLMFDGEAGEYQQQLLEWNLLNQALERCQIWISCNE